MQEHHGISDPGEEIVKKAIGEQITIIPIPGACAFVNALICSGLDTKEFTFLGFLPSTKKERTEKLEQIKEITNTIIMYEAPHRLTKTLQEIEEVLGNREIVLAKELTKIHEQFQRGNITEILEKTEEPKGEYVILIKESEKKQNSLNELTIEEHYKHYENQGLEKKEIIKKIAKDRGVNKNEIYQQFI